jgi:hypothetical protein
MNRRTIINEEEKSRIIGLHKKAIIAESKNILNEVTLQDIQNLLPKDSLGPKGADGKLGSFTLNAIYNALKQTQGTATQGTATQGTATQGTATQGTATQGTATQGTATQGTPAQKRPDVIPAVKQPIPKVGMTAVGDLQDEAEGLNLKVTKVTPISQCNLTELELTGKIVRYGYYQGNDVDSIKRFGEGVKSNNPCGDFASMGNFGSLKFS